MTKQLFSYLSKPALWQRSDSKFWDDSHIAEQMLEAHLNPEWDAASRNHRDIARSVEWLSAMLPAGCRILDLGCGPGLYTAPLAAMGYRVTGIDLSARSLDYAKAHDGNSRYICGNYLELDAHEEYDAVTLIYCDYAALTKPERKELLTRIHRALVPGGQFILDVFTMEKGAETAENQGWTFFRDGGFWSKNPHLCLEGCYFYENGSVQCRKTIVLTEAEAKEYILWDTFYTKEGLLEEIEPFGFKARGIYGSIWGSPYSGKEKTLCAVLQKKEV